MTAIIIAPEAYADLSNYYDYIAQANPDAAMRFFDAARSTFADIAKMPSMGRVYDSTDTKLQNLRKWHIKGFRAYLIFYRFELDRIEIVRILHASQDLGRIFKRQS
jgi:toxin ParE1/3/4